jgi:hypothetical protein
MTPLIFYLMFDHSSYSKNLCNYHLFYCDLIYHQMFFKHDINIFIFSQKINKTNGQTLVKKSTASYIKLKYRGSSWAQSGPVEGGATPAEASWLDDFRGLFSAFQLKDKLLVWGEMSCGDCTLQEKGAANSPARDLPSST